MLVYKSAEPVCCHRDTYYLIISLIHGFLKRRLGCLPTRLLILDVRRVGVDEKSDVRYRELVHASFGRGKP
jgi:hypothetical protein